jgi:hypothetical protein
MSVVLPAPRKPVMIVAGMRCAIENLSLLLVDSANRRLG